MSGFGSEPISPEESDCRSAWDYAGDWVRGPPKGFSWAASRSPSVPAPVKPSVAFPAQQPQPPQQHSMQPAFTEPDEFPEVSIEMV